MADIDNAINVGHFFEKKQSQLNLADSIIVNKLIKLRFPNLYSIKNRSTN